MAKNEAMIPALSLSEMSMSEFSVRLGQSFRTFGFAILRDHGIDRMLIDEAWRQTKAFFALSEQKKRHYDIAGGAGQRGYTPFGREIAKGASASDLKEFWHIGREPEAGEALPPEMPANIWPQELPDFRSCFIRLYSEFDRVGARLLAAIALDLGLPESWFEGPTQQGNSILRLLHYPPLDTDICSAVPGAIRAEAHEDINLITLLLGAEEAGLQLLDRGGEWIDIRPPKGALVVNIGDMLQRLTNHMLPSTTHRVVNPSQERMRESRYSMPFFMHLRPDFIIDPLPQCTNEASIRRYPPISAEDYLRERLREIGLIAPVKE
tara:strand:+ start:219083 stop:220048 length:966 start_codon:yes stop_codon:yes gene_type:complete